jgi:hypothetical protein
VATEHGMQVDPHSSSTKTGRCWFGRDASRSAARLLSDDAAPYN